MAIPTTKPSKTLPSRGSHAQANYDPSKIEKQKESGSWKNCVHSFVIKHFFFLGIAFVVFIAAIDSNIGRKGGPLKPEYSTKYGAVIFLFLLSGLTLKTEDMKKALLYFRLNILIQCYNFIFIPLVFFGIVSLLRLTNMNTFLVDGLLILACMPTTISMCVIFTKSAGGNEAVALFNSSFGNLMGIIVSPSLIFLFFGETSSVNFADVILSLAITVFTPITVGQLIRQSKKMNHIIGRHKSILKKVGEVALLFILFSTFSDTFYNKPQIDSLSLAIIVPLILVFYLTFVFCIFHLTGEKLFYIPSKSDRVAAIYCATHKTVAMGIPLLNIIYGDNPALGIISVPLLIYHPTQLIVGSILVPKFEAWVGAEESDDTMA